MLYKAQPADGGDGKDQEERSVTIGNYSIIYADPPWRYAQNGLQGAAERHYPTMTIDELCALPVAELAARDSALFLWATFPQLPEALRLIKEWGFTYKGVAFVWLKKNKKADSWFYGLGFWTRGRECGNLPAGHKGGPQTAGVGYPSVYHFPHRGPQQKAGRGPGKDCCPHGRPAPCGTVRKADPARLGCVGK